MEFKIGERIRIKHYVDIPQEHKNRAIGKVCGQPGKIVDALTASNGEKLYIIHLDGYTLESKKLWSGECLVSEEAAQYTWDFEVLENVVVAIMYSVSVCDGIKSEVARGHGHIIHNGQLGIAQAASYALKKVYEKLGGMF